MKKTAAVDDGFERLVQAAREADAGVDPPARPLIEATDRHVYRLLRRGEPSLTAGLVTLLQRVGARGRRIAEHVVSADGFADDARLQLLQFLAARDPDHPLVVTYRAVAASLDAGDGEQAASHFESLPRPLRAAWIRSEGTRRLRDPAESLGAMLRSNANATELLLAEVDAQLPASSIEWLATFDGPDQPRHLQRGIKSAFFRLGQRGVAVPAGAAQAPVVESTPPVSEAYVSTADSAGDQAVWILEELPEGGVSAMQGVIDDRGNLTGVSSAVLVRRGRDRVVQSLKEEGGVPVVAMPVDEAIGLLEAAFASNPATAPTEYATWRHRCRADRRGRLRPLPTVDPEMATEWVAQSADLLESDACATWMLRRADAELAHKIITETTESPLQLPASETGRRGQVGMQKAVTQIWDSARRTRLAGRLRATARFFILRDETRLANLALATAAGVLDESAEVPLLAAIVERSLEVLHASPTTPEQDKPSD